MVNVIVVSNQKGGIGKSFISSTLSFLLATNSHERSACVREAERVLLVDTDFQADSTAFITRQERDVFEGHSILEALDELDATKYIHKVSSTLHVLPAASSLATFEQLFIESRNDIDEPHKLLENALAPIADRYDWIIIDTAPSLSFLKMQALNVSLGGTTHVLIPLQTETFGLESIYEFANTLEAATDTNPNISLFGILPVLTDHSSIDAEIIQTAKEEFGDKLFNTVIHRRAELKKMARDGLSEKYAKQRTALDDFYSVIEEVKARV